MTVHLTGRRTAVASSLVVATVMFGSLAGAADSAAAADATPATVTMSPLTQAGASLTGPFTVTAQVTMNDSTQVSVSPGTFVYNNSTLYSKMNYLPAQTVTAVQCPGSCALDWTVDPTTEDAAWPTLAKVSILTQAAIDAGAPTDVPSVGATFQSPVADFTGSKDFERPASPVTADYLPQVLDTGGIVRLTSPAPRSGGETLRASIRTIPVGGTAATEVASATGTWGAFDPSAGTTSGSVALDTSGIAEGGYELFVQGRTEGGQWGWDQFVGQLTVRHEPVVEVWPVDPVLVGSPIDIPVALRGPWSSGNQATGVRVGVDGAAPVTTRLAFTQGVGAASYTTVTVPADRLPLGTHTLTLEVVDQDGQRIGAVQTIKTAEVTFTETVTHGALVVGQQVPVTIKGTAPAGLTYSTCDFAFYDQAGLNNTVSRTVCENPQKSFATTTGSVVRVAGPARFVLIPGTTSGLTMTRTFPATAYAARSATVSAPTSSAYAARLSATIRVADRTDVTKAAVARAGVSVTLQRKAAGTSTWVSLGTTRTDSYGKAVIAFSNTTNGRLRVVATSSVPGATIVSGERVVTSMSTVTWSSLPTAAYSGSLVYARVYAKPYEKGARVLVQARLQGTSTWRSLASATVSSSGYAQPATRLYTRGTWEVRVVRVATTARATGYSTLRRMSIR